MSGSRVPPPEKRCRAIVRAQMSGRVVWSPEHQCLHYAVANGYCRFHQPSVPGEKRPVVDDTPEPEGR